MSTLYIYIYIYTSIYIVIMCIIYSYRRSPYVCLARSTYTHTICNKRMKVCHASNQQQCYSGGKKLKN